MNIGQGWTSGNSGGLSLHHVVGPQNVNELKSVHEQAEHTAVIYISTILLLYVLGLIVILLHHMNQTHGVWAWTCLDLWEELRPWSSSSSEGSKSGVEIVIETVYSEKRPQKNKWKKKKNFLDSADQPAQENSLVSSCCGNDYLKINKNSRGMSVVTLLEDEPQRDKTSKKKSQVLETAL